MGHQASGEKGREVFYYLPDVIAWYVGRSTPQTLDLTAERARLAKEQADKTALENQEKRGRLVDIQPVRELWVRHISDAKMRLLSIPKKIAAPLANCKTVLQAEAVVEAAIYAALQELSNQAPIAPEL